MRFRGKVIRAAWAAGSKNEHEALHLQTARGRFKLRRAGANAFEDPELEALLGQTIVCEGEVRAGQLLLRRWVVETNPSASP
jgi:hypothetical protein